MIKQYIRDRKNEHKIGCMVANKVGDEIRIGYSLCNIALDSFNKYLGTEIARDRLYTDIMRNNSHRKAPRSIKNSLIIFINRAERYYKLPFREKIFYE